MKRLKLHPAWLLAVVSCSTTLQGCLLFAGSSVSNNFGTLIDDGYNLCSNNSANFTRNGSLNASNPQLAPLADNGGPTPTCALLPGSPAIDAAGNLPSGPSADQRGILRPQGGAFDMGAYEYAMPKTTGPLLKLDYLGNSLALTLIGESGKQYLLLVSTNMVDWLPQLTITVLTSGPVQFQRPLSNLQAEFYRVLVR